MTTKLPAETYLPLWQQAAEEEIGILIQVAPEDQLKLVNALYECRKTFRGFEDLIIFQPKPEGTVFIAKKEVELPE